MSLSEILSNGFLNNFSEISLEQAVLILAVALICDAIICLAYWLTYRGVLFSRSYCLSIFAMGIISAFLILSIRTNVYISLGGLGALSIVRFRTAVKEPMDVAFMFFSICSGIVCGSNLLAIAIMGVIIVSAILVLIGRFPGNSSGHILMITADSKAEPEIIKCLESGVKHFRLKSKSKSQGITEYAFDVALKNDSTEFMEQLEKQPGVNSLSVVCSTCEFV